MSDAVYSKMLIRFITVYGEPKTDDTAAFMREYETAMDGFSNAILDRATAMILKSHTYPTWPTVGECFKACTRAAEELAPRLPPERAPIDHDKPGADPVLANILREEATKALDAGNSFADIKRRCPTGGKINLSAPWGREVTDSNGDVVPVRQRRYA